MRQVKVHVCGKQDGKARRAAMEMEMAGGEFACLKMTY